VWDRAQQELSFRGMGTTLSAIALVREGDDEEIAIVNVGDSRVYLLRDGELEQLTTDHTLVQELVNDGQLTEAEADVHPQRHVLTRALGVDPDVDVDLIMVVPYKGDRFLICSDGLPREVSDTQIASILRRYADPEEAAKELVAEARTRGGNDNITVVVVDVVDDDDRAGAASAALAAEPGHTAPIDLGREPAVEEEGTAKGRRAKRAAPALADDGPRARRFTVRVALFFLLLVVLLGAAGAVVGVYARGSYFVGLRGNTLTIYKGRPGGVLWFNPTVAEPTKVSTNEVLPGRIDELKSGKEEPNLGLARQYVQNLQTEAAAHGIGPSGPGATTTVAGTPSTTSATTVAGTPPTVAP